MKRRLHARGPQGLLLAATSAAVAGLISVAFATDHAGISLAPVSSGQSNVEKSSWEPIAEACGIRTAAIAAAAGQAVASGQRPPMSEEVFKNVQLLKGIPVDEFMGTMGLFSAAMGLCCLQCHRSDWAADTPRKQRARAMIQMVNSINQANFSGRKEVTCWTCHRSSTSPQRTPIIDLVYGETPFFPDDILGAAPNAPSADSIFEKYLRSLGSSEQLSRLTSIVAKGTATGYGAALPHPVEVFAKAPNQRATIIHTPEGDSTVTYDGRAGWQATFVTPIPVMPLTGGELEGARLDAALAFPAQIRQVLSDWRVHFPTTLDEHLVQVVQGNGAGGFVATLYFDDESGLLTRVVRYAGSAMGRVPTQIDFTDYREVSGVKIPFKWTLTWLTGRDVIELTDVQVNAAIDPTRFARPAAATRK
jgi:photosynthetic reaction center cytochrome c subunit